MSDINLRIKSLRDYFANGNNSDFASMIGSSEANVRNYIKETEPRANVLVNICEKLEISAEWLLLGKGDMVSIIPSITKEGEKNSNKSVNVNADVLQLFEEYKKAFNAIQTIQDRKIEVLTNSIEALATELYELKS